MPGMGGGEGMGCEEERRASSEPGGRPERRARRLRVLLMSCWRGGMAARA